MNREEQLSGGCVTKKIIKLLDSDTIPKGACFLCAHTEKVHSGWKTIERSSWLPGFYYESTYKTYKDITYFYYEIEGSE